MVKPQRSPFRAIATQRTFPDDRHSPIGFEQIFPRSTVPLHIGPEFRLPKVRSSRGIGHIGAACMAVPEATVHETYGSKPTKDQVWRSGELPIVKPVPEPACMELAAKYQLRFRVFGADPRHHARPGGRINCVDHHPACSEYESRDCRYISQKVIVAIKECRYLSRLRASDQFRHSDMFVPVGHSRCVHWSGRLQCSIPANFPASDYFH